MPHTTTTTPPKAHQNAKLGKIPEGWKVVKFKDIATFNPKSENLPEKFIYIDLDSVKNGRLRQKNLIHKSSAPSRAQRLLTKDDILFQTVRPYQKNNLFFKKSGDYVASSGYAQIRAKQCSGFVYQLIYSQYINNQVMAICTGTSFPAISSKDLSRVNIKLPPLPEQQKIAQILSTWDKAIATQEKLIAQKQQLKKGLMQDLLTGKKRFTGFTEEWEEVKLGDVCVKKSSNLAANSILDRDGNYKVYGATGFLQKVDFYNEEDKYISIVKDGAGVGRVLLCESKSSVLGTLDVIRNEPNIDIYYLYLLLSQINFKKYIIGSTIPHIYFKDYKLEKILLPSSREQQKIASVLSSMDKEIEQLIQHKTALVQQKQGLMQVLLSGEKRVKI